MFSSNNSEIRICGGNCKNKIGNCKVPSNDGLPVQCVGPWAEDKYYYFERYLNSSCRVREKFSDKGNAIYIDLFSGPGKCIIKNRQVEILGGSLRALNRENGSFNDFYFYDKEEENTHALKVRIKNENNCEIKRGDSNSLIYELVKNLLRTQLTPDGYKYHFAFIDPFGPEAFKFDTLEELSKLNKVDILMHLPVGPIRRNYNQWLKKPNNTILDNFLGTDIWHKKAKTKFNKNIYHIIISVFKDRLSKRGLACYL